VQTLHDGVQTGGNSQLGVGVGGIGVGVGSIIVSHICV
jgi:hypothetical protein